MNDDDLDQQIAEEVGEWSTNSNDCVYITLLRGPNDEHARFQPEHTYPIFGDEERIFGYQGLNIELTFAAHTLEPRLHTTWDKVFHSNDPSIAPTDITSAFQEVLPLEANAGTRISFTNVSTFSPPGEKVRSYTKDGQKFEVRCASLADPDAKKMLERMQVLVPMFIEGGSALQIEQDWTTQRWKLFTLWSIEPSYGLVGYGTSYRVFTLPSRKTVSSVPPTTGEPDFLTPTAETPLDLLSRERLSQFLILPPFQQLGHGHELYRAMYHHLVAPSSVCEFTVEDPNESFDDLRDFCDLTYLRGQVEGFADLEVSANIPAELLQTSHTVPSDQIVSRQARDRIRKAAKMEQRQFDRLVEMHTLSKIPPLHRSLSRITRKGKSGENDRKYFFWRMYLKKRLTTFNKDALDQLDIAERVARLEALVDSNQEHYLKVLERVMKKEREGIDFDGDSLSVRAKKRKVLDEDDDDEMDTASNASKRPRA